MLCVVNLEDLEDGGDVVTAQTLLHRGHGRSRRVDGVDQHRGVLAAEGLGGAGWHGLSQIWNVTPAWWAVSSYSSSLPARGTP